MDMPRKEALAENGVVRVTFELPSDVSGDVVHLVGDFTGWQGTPMARQEDGSWRASVDLAPERSYEFRYLIDGARWENDWAADRYVPNAYGQENSVVETPPLDSGTRTPTASAARTSVRTSARTSPAERAAAETSRVRKAAKKTAKKTGTAKSTAKTSPASKTAKKATKKATKKTATAPAKSAAKTSPARKGSKNRAPESKPAKGPPRGT
jgi:hypothetical protein